MLFQSFSKAPVIEKIEEEDLQTLQDSISTIENAAASITTII